jgi:hypothetical protein
VGRDRLIKSLWEAVEQQSLVITAERRIENQAGGFLFRFPLIRRWWKINRGL